ncbi:DNA polymerase III subunit alpha [Mycoplasma iguanae]|uniref:DNA-directed DNA polymerase n=1 Tax=Mycoplasma iguanae TaxID=292461 RepID=A0ABY5RCK4_9MOLU|nr:DNA polymerase III subunit alpha [Mycoplasma iguanae]UVD81940.1 DNA polymerase III subunit alpha [Mycoplasma iguanae]
MKKLVNFHNNTEYSFLESTITIDKLIENAKENNLEYLAITDHNSMFGVPIFLKECKKNNIKPIIGLDLDIENFRLILIAKNYQGFLELSKLSHHAMSKEKVNLENIDFEHLIAIDHPSLGYFAMNKKQLNIPNYYIVQNNPTIANAIWVNEHVIVEDSDNDKLSIIRSISGNSNEKLHYKGLNFEPEINPKIIENTNNLLTKIDFDIKFDNHSALPKFKNNLNLSSMEYLKRILLESINKNMDEFKKYPDFQQRVRYELEIIEKLGYEDYFLIIWDFIKWAKEREIYIGPGRGSAAGSLISYLLNITEVNPLKYGLLFERFLNPKRISKPDIDIDIQDSRRDEIIQYIIERYGPENVATITTFQTLGAKMAIRDVGRALNINIAEINDISKMLPAINTLKESYEAIPKFKAKIESKPEYQKLYEIASFIEGLPRQHGTHAAGIVISEKKINDIIPTMKLEDNRLQTQFSMDYLENFGLLKIDLLGLKNLTVIDDILQLINKDNPIKIKMSDLPLHDLKTNSLLSNGRTIGIFQLESPGMISTLRKVRVNKFEDVADIISLFRPGPMKMIPNYISYKNGKEKIPFISSEYNKIVDPTHGIIIYQEQIMQICQQISGMDFSEADILRKAISKKDFSEIAIVKDKFFLGARINGYDEMTVKSIFDLIEKFAEYGFNKSHAVSYAVISYKMAYLKTHYPRQFFESLINNAQGNQDTIEKYFIEAKSLGFKIASPDINFSSLESSYANNILYLPLNMIKGIGKVAVTKLVDERNKNGIFTSFANFAARAKFINLGEANIKLLIESNTLKSFGNIKTLEKAYKESIGAYVDFFNNLEEFNELNKTENVNFKTPQMEVLKLDKEYERTLEIKHLGFPYNYLIKNNWETSFKLEDLEENQTHKLALMVEKIEPFHDKYQREMGKIVLSDSSKTVKIFIFSSKWNSFKNLPQGKFVFFNITKKDNNYIIDQNWEIAG